MSKKFLYSDTPQTIELLKQSYEVFLENDNGCYFINNPGEVEFDNSLVCDNVIYTNSISLEL
ncbi:hypothetical protein CWE04_11775 [Thomasclavelia cocleata]|uniref:Uncharacterized protein n=1 Tax=Thomasclavelia cocleata TaxID=69824 RepID=A0A1I0BLB4_9FIRM|nr:hypothetical protein [Thomasclavelia cocleata]MCR1960217.1 hypothetical protein [Thomasclavelia cocleata]NDO41809.1 hypothetical protein [Thomasclavelia cocleata]PJN79881.1 hypothetical protein CWE04_11775 [Thomasclavelia cocleata]SET07059.1 hypothetical protein SAMN04489758_101148 [Thomasclavelia cocleata]